MSEIFDPRTAQPKAQASHASLRERLCLELVGRWRRGERVPAEAYLLRCPDLDGESAFELVLTEVVLRQEYGEPAQLDEFLWRFPQFADRLERHFALHATLAAEQSGGSAFPTLTSRPPALVAPREGFPTVPGYELLEELGRGGMGVIYKAREANLGRYVALKFLPAEYAGDSDRLDRLLREARTASALNHPHICTVHALGEHEGRPFIVMEFIEGVTLHTLLAQRLNVDAAVRLVRQAAQALGAAHAAGVVHRDIKPENIMLRNDGYVKVLDFGLARRLPTLAHPGPHDGSTTEPGAILGTVAYMSPEQARGDVAESASDVFSLGIVLYQLVTGQHPFETDSPLAMLHAIATRRPLSPARLNPAVPAALAGLMEAMLHKDARLRPTAVEVESRLAALAGAGKTPPAATSPRPIVHRAPELARLRAAWDEADAGRGLVMSVSGEPGIGKTTFVEDFLASLDAAGRSCLIARGRCSERLAETEAYLPVLDALEDLLAADGSGAAARAMQIVAPTWYAQVVRGGPSGASRPATSDVVSLEDGRPATERASSQQAMLREFCSLVQEISRLGTLVFFFDDVHWADGSTVDLLAHLGRHCRDLRVLVLVTYRPTEMLLGPHPYHRVRLELEGQGAGAELVLGFLSREDVQAYLSLAFPGHAFPPDFAALIYSRTEGSPLFLVDLLRYLRERGVIAEIDGRWSLAEDLPDLRRELPGSVRSMIQRKLDRLEESDRLLLAAASVQGHEFDSAVVAGALAFNAAEVEERLQSLDRVHGLVRALREHEFPDRTLTVRYVFVHILYQQALYHDLQPTRRATLGAALAQALDRRHGEPSTAAASELAWLYEVGRDFPRAAWHTGRAAQNAASVFAHREAVVLARRGLRLLEAVPDSSERAALELPLQTTLGMQLQMTEGFATAAAKQAYTRARELCRQATDPAPLFPVLWGLWLFSKVRSELSKAQEMADELASLARQLRDLDLALQAHQALGMTAFCRGEPAAAIQHVEQAAALYDPVRHRTHAFLFGQDPAVMCQAYGEVALWLLGYPEQARRQSEETIRRSRALSPSSQAIAMHFAGMVHQLCRDPSRTRECADTAMAIATEHGFSFWRAGGRVLRGWSLAELGEVDEGIRQLQQGLRDWRAIDSVTYETYYLGLLADILRKQGRFEEGRRVVEEALDLARRTGEGLYEAELHRLQGELCLPERVETAEACFRQAIAVAQRQEAKSLELRAATSLARLNQYRGGATDAQQLLADVYGRFTEGLQTADLQEAKLLLERLE
jgi:predicted ATPase/predicted Ser/Thr protein kinase